MFFKWLPLNTLRGRYWNPQTQPAVPSWSPACRPFPSIQPARYAMAMVKLPGIIGTRWSSQNSCRRQKKSMHGWPSPSRNLHQRFDQSKLHSFDRDKKGLNKKRSRQREEYQRIVFSIWSDKSGVWSQNKNGRRSSHDFPFKKKGWNQAESGWSRLKNTCHFEGSRLDNTFFDPQPSLSIFSPWWFPIPFCILHSCFSKVTRCILVKSQVERVLAAKFSHVRSVFAASVPHVLYSFLMHSYWFKVEVPWLILDSWLGRYIPRTKVPLH